MTDKFSQMGCSETVIKAIARFNQQCEYQKYLKKVKHFHRFDDRTGVCVNCNLYRGDYYMLENKKICQRGFDA